VIITTDIKVALLTEAAGKLIDMVKVFNRYLPLRLFIFLAIDFACLLLISAFCIVASASWGTSHASYGLLPAFCTGVLCVAGLYFFDLYDLEVTRHSNDVFIAAMRAVGVGALLLVPASIVFRHIGLHLRYIETGLVIGLIFVSSYRIVYDHVASHVLRGERILLIGQGRVIESLAQRVRDQSYLPLQLVAIMSSSKSVDLAGQPTDRNAELASLVASFSPGRIAIDRSLQGDVISAAHLIQLRQRGIRIEDAATLYESMTARVPVEMLQAPNFAFGPGFGFTPWGAAIHRFIDYLAAAAILLLIWPLLLFLAVWVRLDSKGPSFYRQERVGLNNKTFEVIKFRSMRIDAESTSGPVWAQQKDRRVTRCGRILRTLRLDELPQIWNVLRGDMSLVGPRPERQHFVDMLRTEIPFYDLRHSVRPGITGWAQVCAPYGASIEESLAKVEYDLFYLKNKSVAFDLFILCRTAKVCLLGRGAR
jgi:exopolysaccharide biosynthesis polyprenyl glycosylphosphotransferase